MAVSKKQAVGMMHKKYREVVRRSKGKKEDNFTERLYEVVLSEEILMTLSIKIFEDADADLSYAVTILLPVQRVSSKWKLQKIRLARTLT